MTGDMKVNGKEALVRTLVVNEDLVVRKGLVSLLRGSGRALVVGEVCNGRHAQAMAQASTPDVILLELDMQRREGLSVLPELCKLGRVLMLASSDEAHAVDQALRAGATGYLLHRQFSSAELVTAVMATARGRGHLSPGAITALAESLRSVRPADRGVCARDRASGLSQRELEIMDYIARGRTNPEIARALFLSEKTVKNHVNRIYAKLRVSSRAAAVALWLGARVGEPTD